MQALGTFEKVAGYFPAYIEHRPLQIEAINTVACLPRAGVYAEVGTGKTLIGTACALLKRVESNNRTIVTMPPILLKQWKRWLDGLNGGITSVIYAGTPKERAQISLDADFVLMSLQIFKKDYERICRFFADLPVTLIIDEADAIKNPGSDNYKKVRDFVNA